MIRLILALLVAMAVAMPLPAAPPPGASSAPATRPQPAVPLDAETLAVLEQLDAKIAGYKDLIADFRQEKHTPVLRKPLVSTGTVRVKGQRVRWDTAAPHASAMVIGGGEVRVYYPDQKVVEVYEIGRRIGDLAASPLPRLAAMREHFALERAVNPPSERGLTLRLTPKEESLRERLAEVRVLLDPETGFARRVEMLDPDGERTIIDFTGVETDTGLSDEDVGLSVPAGTKVSRPLGGASADERK